MVVPIKKDKDETVVHFLEWALELLGLYTPPPSTEVNFSPPPEVSAGISSYLKEVSGNEYISIMSGRSGDRDLALVRKDGAIDDMHLDDDSFQLCSQPDKEAISATKPRLGITCRSYAPPSAYLTAFSAIDSKPFPPRTVELAAIKDKGTISTKEVAQLYFSLAPAMRNSLLGIETGSAPLNAWRFSSMGIIHVGSAPDYAEFYENAARALTMRLLLNGVPLIEQWDSMGKSTSSSCDFSSADDIAKTVGMIYANPDEVKSAAGSDRSLAPRLWLLANLGYLRKDQEEYLVDPR